uniref:Ig-like domain-containing protein n=1 Tax=Suricata suricatta TaxID=37032 RepID=A0A673T663_SURSU
MEKHLRASLVVLWLHVCWVSGKNQVEEYPPSQVIQEGEYCTFQCNYTVSPFGHLTWYKQGPGRSYALLMLMNNGDSKSSSGRYTMTLDASSKHSSLHITAAQLSDSAFYICVVSAPCFPGTCSQYPNLHLQGVKDTWQIRSS